MEDAVITLIVFLFLSAIIVTYITTRHREKMTMMEKGLTSEEIKAMYTRDIKRNPLTSLKWGILFVFGGLAIILGNYLHTQFFVDEGVIVGMVCLFAGIALLLFYTLAAKKTGGQS